MSGQREKRAHSPVALLKRPISRPPKIPDVPESIVHILIPHTAASRVHEERLRRRVMRCPRCNPLTRAEARRLGDKAYRLPWNPCHLHKPPPPPGWAYAVMRDTNADPGEVARAQQAIRDHASAEGRAWEYGPHR